MLCAVACSDKETGELATVVTGGAVVDGSTVKCDGQVTADGGSSVFDRGICYSKTTQTPTANDAFASGGSGRGSFSAILQDLDGGTYYYRAYATNEAGVAYGDTKTFTVVNNSPWIDMGLPSGLLWAKCNVGASNPEDYGNYYAWGETTPKEVYDMSTYIFYSGEYHSDLTKYCSISGYGYNGYADNLTTLQAMDDAATAVLGNGARTPTISEWEELLNYCTYTWVIQNGVLGYKFTAVNGNTLFLPAAGHRDESELWYDGSRGYYWSSTLFVGNPQGAKAFVFDSEDYDICDGNYGFGRIYGYSVRAVHQK